MVHPLLSASLAFTPWLATRPSAKWACTDAQRAARVRWDANIDSYAESGEVGLGGGIEWVLHEKFCQRMVPVFRDAAVTCDDLLKATHAAVKVWEERHPIIYFTAAESISKAELVIGAQSKTVVDATAKDRSLLNDPEIRRAHQLDILTGVGLDDGELGQEGTIAFAQTLPENHQDGKLPTGKLGAALMGTHGERFVANEGSRKRFRIIFNTDHAYYLRTDPACYDDDPTGRVTVRYQMLLLLLLAAVLLPVGTCLLVRALRRAGAKEAAAEAHSAEAAAKEAGRIEELRRQGVGVDKDDDGSDDGEGAALLINHRVVLRDLTARPELNGHSGKVVSHDGSSGRYGVVVDGINGALLLKPANLVAAPLAATARRPESRAGDDGLEDAAPPPLDADDDAPPPPLDTDEPPPPLDDADAPPPPLDADEPPPRKKVAFPAKLQRLNSLRDHQERSLKRTMSMKFHHDKAERSFGEAKLVGLCGGAGLVASALAILFQVDVSELQLTLAPSLTLTLTPLPGIRLRAAVWHHLALALLYQLRGGGARAICPWLGRARGTRLACYHSHPRVPMPTAPLRAPLARGRRSSCMRSAMCWASATPMRTASCSLVSASRRPLRSCPSRAPTAARASK